MKTLVVGATGLLGGYICRQLLARGGSVRALVRDSSTGIDPLRALGAEPVVGDLKDPSSLDRACRSVTAVVSTANAIAGRLKRDTFVNVDRDGQLALLQCARASGAERFVYVSVSPQLPSNNLFVQCKRDVEHAVRASGMAWTILQPAAFMEIHLGAMLGWDYAKGRARILGSPTAVKSFISAEDVAAFAVEAIRLPAAANRDLYLTGPEPLSTAHALRIAERLTGHSFKVQRIPSPALRILSFALRPFAPVTASLMAMSAADVEDCADMLPLEREFGVRLTPFSDYVRTHILRAPASS